MSVVEIPQHEITRRFVTEDDEALAVRAAAGSAPAFGELVRRYEKRLYNFLLRKCSVQRDVEDLTQDAFVEAWKSIRRYNPRWRFSTWLYTIAFRQATAHYRRTRVRPGQSPLGPSVAAGGGCPHEEALRRERCSNLWAIVDSKLEPEHRQALWLRYVEELSVQEIALVLGRRSVTTRVVLHRARQALGAALEANGHGGDDATSPASEIGRDV